MSRGYGKIQWRLLAILAAHALRGCANGCVSVPNFFLTRSATRKLRKMILLIYERAGSSEDFHGDFAQSINREQRAVAARN